MSRSIYSHLTLYFKHCRREIWKITTRVWNGICISWYFHFDMMIMTWRLRQQPKYTHPVSIRQGNWKLFTPLPSSCFYDYQNMKRNEFQKQKLLVHFLLKMASRIIVNIHCSIYSLNINIFCLHTLLTEDRNSSI